MRATKAIIHLESFSNNVKAIKNILSKNTKLCVSVKADAYGHGSVLCAKKAVESGADVLAVATPQEGIELRKNGINVPILMLSLCEPSEVEDVIKNNITPFVFDEEYINLFEKAANKLGIKNFPVHIAVDTGMGRIGVLPQEAGKLAHYIEETSSLFLEGMGTHCAVSDGIKKEDVDYTDLQLERFKQAIKSVKDAGINPGICHCANSAATLTRSDMHFDMVRTGIIVYGYYPDEVTEEYLTSIKKNIHLEPVMTLQTQVCAIRPFTKGQSVGYGRTWQAKEDTDIAVLPIGYGDGLFRNFASSGVTVAINGKSYPIRGRICMDQCMVDIGKNSGIKRWDKVIIFGNKKDNALQTADDIARLTGTISYEITTCITKRVERIIK